MAETGSVTTWLAQLQCGDPEAVDRLWERYFRRLQGLARAKLPSALQNDAHTQDVAQDAFVSLWRGAQKGQFPDLAGRDQLWRLLVVITARKAYRLARAEAREGAARVPEWELDQFLGREPEPGFAVQAAEECGRLIALLGDARLEAVARARLDGLTVPEIAAQLGCSPRTVDRKLALIQQLWAEEVQP